MIEFPCRCGRHTFSLPESAAGEEVQCPACHILRDVPTRSDLLNLGDDGAFIIGEAIAPMEATEQRMNDVKRAFTHDRVDEHGEEIDMRLQFEDALKVGIPETQSTQINVAIDRPQYDPFTGELVRPMDVVARSSLAESNVDAASPVLNYATTDLPREIAIHEIPRRLLQPANVFVMLVVLFAHLVLQGLSQMLAAGLFPIAPLWILVAGLILGQYANTVEEIGPEQKDDLPRPLRDFEFYIDLWKPFTNAAGASILAFAPAGFALAWNAPIVVVLGLYLVGSFLYPAIFLTATTSGSTPNLRPDRVWSVVRACGQYYWILAAMFFAANCLYLLGLWRLQVDTFLLLSGLSKGAAAKRIFPWWFERWVTYPAFFAGLFTMHWFLWSLGLAYRAHHARFKWILQRHEPVRFLERIGRRQSRPAK